MSSLNCEDSNGFTKELLCLNFIRLEHMSLVFYLHIYLCYYQYWVRLSQMLLHLPATLASLHASYMSCLISGLSSAIVSPTVTNLSTAKFTAWPTLATARKLRSEHSGRSLCEINVEICKDIAFWWVHKIRLETCDIPFLDFRYNW